MKIPEKLEELRLKRFTNKLTTEEVAKLLQLSHPQSYDKYKSGGTNTPVHVLSKVCNLYKVSPDYFLEEYLKSATCIVPHLIRYEANKKKYIYHDLVDEKNNILRFNNKYGVTDFFTFFIDCKAFSEARLEYTDCIENMRSNAFTGTDYLYFFETIIEGLIAKKDFRPSKNIAYLPFDEILLDPKSFEAVAFLMQKQDHKKIIGNNNDISSVCMIATREKNDVFLAIIDKSDDHCSIIPFYDITKKLIILEHPYKDENGIIKKLYTSEKIEKANEYPNHLSLDDIEILASVLCIYDPQYMLH